MKMWVMFSSVGAALFFFSASRTTSDSGSGFGAYGDGRSLTRPKLSLVRHMRHLCGVVSALKGLKNLHVNCQVHEMANTAADDISPVISEPGGVRLQDYQPADPSPTSKWSVNPGPIQHGAPLMPYLPIPSPAPPASPLEHHG